MGKRNKAESEESVWDSAVPIIKEGSKTDIYVCDGIGEPSFYNELCHTLYKADAHETITIHINTPGGIVDSAFMIIDAIKASKAYVVGYLTGTVASAGTMIILACDEIIVADHTTFMIHNYSGGMHGKGHEMKARQEFTDTSLNATFKMFYSGFLTEQEMTDVIEGKDMWMGKEDVLTRWHNRQTYLETPAEKEEPVVDEASGD